MLRIESWDSGCVCLGVDFYRTKIGTPQPDTQRMDMMPFPWKDNPGQQVTVALFSVARLPGIQGSLQVASMAFFLPGTGSSLGCPDGISGTDLFLPITAFWGKTVLPSGMGSRRSPHRLLKKRE